MGWTEILFIMVIALVVLGPDRMMETARTLGKALREVRRVTEEVTRSISVDQEPPRPGARPSRPRQEPTTQQDSPQEPEGSQPRDGGTGPRG